MMDLLLATSGGESQSASGGYVDDVFSAYTYTGNGSTQTITNGIDLAGKGGLVWFKSRTGTESHAIYDTARGTEGNRLSTNLVVGNSASGEVTSFNSDGVSLNQTEGNVNVNAKNFISWTFRKAPKFFDVVTYTGNGVAGRQIAHSLGVAPGMVIVKNTTEAASWKVWHRTLALNNGLVLNSPNAIEGQYWLYNTAPTDSLITIGNAGSDAIESNKVGNTYVAYLFAHDPSAEGIIQCGSVTTDGSGNATVNLGWEPQFVITKSSSAEGTWYLNDVMRDWSMSSGLSLQANTSGAETNTWSGYYVPTATGFQSKGGLNANTTYIYLAIRRPNKPPTTGTQVYNAIARTGTGAAATVTGVGFAPDLVIPKTRNNAYGAQWFDRIRGKLSRLGSYGIFSEQADARVDFDRMDGVGLPADTSVGVNRSGDTLGNWFFRRAKGFFDVACYTGTGVARTVNHNLGVAPELMIIKERSASYAYGWRVYVASLGNNYGMVLNETSVLFGPNTWLNTTTPTASVFSLSSSLLANASGSTYVAYLFATLPGISKVGSYTGNGTSQAINCGFATGARFILVKRTDATGDWYVWDSVRGIIAANDPHLSLNTAAAEVTTDDSVDPEASGFIVNQNTATNINVSGGQYIFLAIA